MTEVYLAVYDLSQGMARTLSLQFLGPNHVIDMIPHTALLVFGKEYFFGGGIQAVEPHAFRRSAGIHPVQTQRLGITQVSQNDFDAWCQRTAAQKYNVQTYDLLKCNCNHFSNEAALQGLKLPQGVPAWILQVPQRFLSSPMGQLVRPMLEQMQITQTAPVQATTSPPVMASVALPAVPLTGGGNHHNPWASSSSSGGGGSTAAAAVPLKQGPQSPMVNSPAAKIQQQQSRPITPPLMMTSKNILSKYTKPMLSNDTKSLTLCASKLAPHLNDAAQVAISRLATALQGMTSSSGSAGNSSTTSPGKHNVQEDVEICVPELWRLVQEAKLVSFSLLFLRLVVLYYADDSSPAVTTCMEGLVQALDDQSKSDDTTTSTTNHHPQLFTTPASRSLAWCVASNFAGSTSRGGNKNSPTAAAASVPSSRLLVEAAIRDWNHDTVQVRQAACTFLYNFVVCNGALLDHDEETVVSLVCSSLESLVEESDPTTRLRRLLVGARVVFGVHHHNSNNSMRCCKDEASPSSPIIEETCNEMAKDLVKDLGFVSLLKELASTDYTSPPPNMANHPDTIECQQLALELIECFQQSSN